MRVIAGTFKGRRLKTTTGPGFRPAMGRVREAVFSMLEARGAVWQGARVLDLFAGSGSLGFEALSGGAETVCFVESAPYAARVIAANAALLGLGPERCTLLREDVATALARPPSAPFQVVFIDPPYRMRLLEPVLHFLLLRGWATAGTLVNAEVEARATSRPEEAHPSLEPLADRRYGQTRVLLWRVRTAPGA